MRLMDLLHQAFPVKVNLLQRRWAVRFPYIFGIILIVVAWSAAAVASVINEWQASSGTLVTLISMTALVVFSGVFLAASLVFHGMFYEAFLPTGELERNGPSWLVKAYGAAAWLLMLSVMWLAGRGFLETASSAELFRDAIHAVWVYTARAFLGVYFGVWVLGGLCGMMSGRLSTGRLARE